MTLRVEAAGYRYAGTEQDALTSVNFELGPGEVVGVVGAGEAGKSTLCLVAAGLAPATIGGRLDGRVSIDGAETATAPPHVLAQRCGILFQHPATQLSATAPTVWEEVAVGPRNLALPLEEVIQRVWAALGLLRIDGLAERDAAKLSGGQMQLVALAAVLAMRPAYLVLDEPTAQLDPAGSDLVAEAIAGLAAATGTGVLIAEQKTDLLAAICRRVIVLHRGRVALDGEAATALADDRLPDWGVEPPSRVRLARALAAAGMDGTRLP